MGLSKDISMEEKANILRMVVEGHTTSIIARVMGRSTRYIRRIRNTTTVIKKRFKFHHAHRKSTVDDRTLCIAIKSIKKSNGNGEII